MHNMAILSASIFFQNSHRSRSLSFRWHTVQRFFFINHHRVLVASLKKKRNEVDDNNQRQRTSDWLMLLCTLTARVLKCIFFSLNVWHSLTLAPGGEMHFRLSSRLGRYQKNKALVNGVKPTHYYTYKGRHEWFSLLAFFCLKFNVL